MATPFSIIDYGRRLEALLRAQREVSSIIQHSGEVGSAREYFVHSVLRRFLPANVVVGRGEIVDGKGGRSKQQDLLLYRSNFPVIDSLAGSHLYLVEGVLATIEVKSNLDEKELIRASQNIESVRTLVVSEIGLGDAEEVDGGELALEDLSYGSIGRRIGRGGAPVPVEDPLLRVADERIWTYIFAFDGVSHDTLNSHADAHGWLTGAGPDCLCVLGKAFGATVDAPVGPQRRPTSGELFLIDECSEPLGWLLGHLVWVLCRRFRAPALRPYF